MPRILPSGRYGWAVSDSHAELPSLREEQQCLCAPVESVCMAVTAPHLLQGAALTPRCAAAEEYKRIRDLIVGSGKRPGMMKAMGKGGGARGSGMMNPHNMQNNIAQMSRMLPPDVLKKMGGAGALQGLLKQMEQGGMK